METEIDTDAGALARIARGDLAATEQLMRAHGDAIYKLARRITGDAQLAEEVLQDTLLGAISGAKSYRSRSSGALPWLLVIARNRAIDIVRSRRAKRVTTHAGLEQVACGRSTADDRAEAVELEEAARRKLALLCSGPRQAIELAYWSGLSHSEVAERLSVPLGTAKTWIRSGLRRLRELLVPATAAA